MHEGLEQSQYFAVNQLASLHPPGQDISCSSEAKQEPELLTSWYCSQLSLELVDFTLCQVLESQKIATFSVMLPHTCAGINGCLLSIRRCLCTLGGQTETPPALRESTRSGQGRAKVSLCPCFGCPCHQRG